MVSVDENSLRDLGPRPWSGHIHARLVRLRREFPVLQDGQVCLQHGRLGAAPVRQCGFQLAHGAGPGRGDLLPFASDGIAGCLQQRRGKARA